MTSQSNNWQTLANIAYALESKTLVASYVFALLHSKWANLIQH